MKDKYTIILCSDNHGQEAGLRFLQKEYMNADYFIHCGDTELPAQATADFVVVQGNNDYYGNFPASRILEIGLHRIYVCHGHRDMFFGRYDMLAEKAEKAGCDIAFCGHSHVPFAGEYKGVLCLNSGSIWRNRDGSEPSYMIVTFSGSDVSYELKRYNPMTG